MSATPTGLAEENGHLPPVQSMCGTSVEVAWLPIAFSADVRMSVEQALRTRRTKLPKGRGGYITVYYELLGHGCFDQVGHKSIRRATLRRVVL